MKIDLSFLWLIVLDLGYFLMGKGIYDGRGNYGVYYCCY